MKKYMAKSLADHALRHDDDWGRKVKARKCNTIEDLEDLPLREKMRPYGSTRVRSLRLDILENFLCSRLGMSWNEVFSEVCKTNSLDNFNQWQLRSELEELVAQNVTRVGKRLVGPDGCSVYRDFWVDAKSGVLHAVPEQPRYRYQPQKRFQQIALDAQTKYVCFNEIWFRVSFAPIPTAPEAPAFDCILQKEVQLSEDTRLQRHSCWQSRQEWDAAIYPVSLRQIGKRELRKVRKLIA